MDDQTEVLTMTNTKLGVCLAAACVMMMSSLAAARQCEERWFSFGGVAGLQEDGLAATLWDPDGSGPRGPLVVVGGEFYLAGDAPGTRFLAVWDPSTRAWSSLGSELDGFVNAVLACTNGDLIVGGRFNTAGGVTANNIARFDGHSWHEMGTGLGGEDVYDLVEMPNGHIVAGGAFGFNTSDPIKFLADWDGAQWNPIPNSLFQPVVDIEVMSNGDLAISAPPSLVRWNGRSWVGLGQKPNGPVYALRRLRNGDLVAGGDFQKAGGKDAVRIARWDGTTWWPLGSGLPEVPSEIVELSSGLIVAGSGQTFPAMSWDGAEWRQLGVFDTGYVRALAPLPGGGLFAGGSFRRVDDVPLLNAAVWDGAAWGSTSTGGSNFQMVATAIHPSGDVFVAGEFTAVGGVPAGRVARWDGQTWHALEGGVNKAARVIAVAPNGDVYVGGDFTSAGEVSARYIARWDGRAWHALGAGPDFKVYAIDFMPNGEVVAGGYGGGGLLARWNGSDWVSMGTFYHTTDYYPIVHAVKVLKNGDLIAGGFFNRIGSAAIGRIARWRNGQWSAIGPGLGEDNSRVFSIAEQPNGDIVACGSIWKTDTNPANLARWDGTQWLPVGTRTVYSANALDIAPSGALLMGGSIKGVGDSLLRFDGNDWAVVAGKLDKGVVADIAVRPDGQIIVVGNFLYASGIPAAYVARVACACPSDLDGDGLIDSGDFNQFEAWFENADIRADFNGDGFVNGNDYDEFADHFDVGC